MRSQQTGQRLAGAQKQIEKLECQVEALSEQLEERNGKIRGLEAQIEHLSKQLFGPKSDRPSDEAQALMLEILQALGQNEGKSEPDESEEKEEEGKEERKKNKKNRKPTGRQMFPAHLEREVVTVGHCDEPKIDPETGQELIFMGYDEIEQLVEEPARLYVRVIRRAKYALPKESQGDGRPGVVTEPIPSQWRGPIDRCKASVAVLATILVLRFCYHLPYYRLQERYWRLGRVWLPRSTMCGWARGCAEALEPIWNEMRKRVLANEKLGFDDTRVSMLEPKAGKTASTRLWSYCGLTDRAPYQLYDFQLNREMSGPLEFLEGFSGIAVGDALSTNKAVVRRRDQIVLAGCWDHARRKFVDASEEDGVMAAQALAYIKMLYRIEKEAEKNCPDDPEGRRVLRQEKAVAVLGELKGWLEEQKNKPELLPKSKLSVAIHYVLNHWREFNVYVEDGEVPISNCLCEQSFKAIATGRKNWLFFGSEQGGKTAAIIYSMVMTCRRLDIDPQKYLTDVLARVNDHPANRIEELLPDRWKQARLEAGEDTGLRLEDHRPLRRAS